MNNLHNKLFYLLILCSFFSLTTFGQENRKKEREYKKKPLWIDMMNDPTANYFETVKAFRIYWEHRELPKEAFEEAGKDAFEKEVGLITDEESEEERERENERKKKKRRKKKNNPTVQYASEVRAFKGWFHAVQPWVREDGSIISEEERQRILDAQRNELLELERLNQQKNN